jgi:hypothetical protein
MGHTLHTATHPNAICCTVPKDKSRLVVIRREVTQLEIRMSPSTPAVLTSVFKGLLSTTWLVVPPPWLCQNGMFSTIWEPATWISDHCRVFPRPVDTCQQPIISAPTRSVYLIALPSYIRLQAGHHGELPQFCGRRNTWHWTLEPSVLYIKSTETSTTSPSQIIRLGTFFHPPAYVGPQA